MKVTQIFEEKSQELLGVSVKLTFDSMDYFLGYIFHKSQSSPQLHRNAWDFFLPVFRQFPRFAQKINTQPEQVELDFNGGWRFNLVTE